MSTTDADKLIAPLLPPKKDVVPDPGDGIVIPPFTEPEPPKQWYEKRWVQVGIAGGVIALIAGSIALSNSLGADTRPSDFNGMGETTRE
jgi:hypothetical protein